MSYDPTAFAPGTVKANPINLTADTEESAFKMDMADSGQQWFIVNSKHGGAYTSGVELEHWPVVYTPPTLIEE